MAGWRLFKRRPDARPVTAVVDSNEDFIRILQKLPPQPSPDPPSESASVSAQSTRHRRSSSLRSHRSGRSSRSSRSGKLSNQAAVVRRRSSRSTMRAYSDRRCFACSRTFSGSHCTNCDTTYDHTCQVDAQPLDLSLCFDLATTDDHMLLETIVCDTFSNVDATVQTFICGDDIDVDKLEMFYQIIETPTSTAPMRAVLQGAQTCLLHRQYTQISRTELQYLLIVLHSPAFTHCSMFTKITGPLQKLARYSSLRSRARVVLELTLGLCSNLSIELRSQLKAHLASLEKTQFQGLVELLNSYIGHRLMFHYQHKAPQNQAFKAKDQIKVQWYSDDWRIAATAKLLQVLFEASSLTNKLPVAAFYNMVVDHVELCQDFDLWQSAERRRSKHHTFDLWNCEPTLLNRFSFCQFPFLLTITSKSNVFRHSLQRKVREVQLSQPRAPSTSTSPPQYRSPSSGASSIYSMQYAQATNAQNSAVHAAWALASQQVEPKPFLELSIRRDHILEDSKALLLMSTTTELKKRLRIQFEEEMGIDAGGLCKEWMHLLFTELARPELQLFVQDEDSAYAWLGDVANLEYYTLVGITLGLAFNNGLMMDTGLPGLLFKLLLDAPFSLDDLEEVWPVVTKSLRSILAYEQPDFEDVFCLTFEAPSGDALLENGENINVTSADRDMYVDLVVKHMTRSTPQLSALQAGFLKACDTVALPMFTAAEVEALLRGERRPIDLLALRNNTRYIHWGTKANIVREPVLIWFWEFFESLSPEKQALLLVFITATPRIPATGIASMQFRISCLGPDSDRLPVAHTCFNQLGLYRYRSRAKLVAKLTLAMTECQSFGIK